MYDIYDIICVSLILLQIVFLPRLLSQGDFEQIVKNSSSYLNIRSSVKFKSKFN